jgi:hypothetical protein
VVKGYMHRYLIAFLYEEPLDNDLQARLLKFLRGFGTGVIRKTSDAKRVYFFEETRERRRSDGFC